MKVVEVTIDPEKVEKGLQSGKPRLLFSREAQGCECGCSPGRWLLISDGRIALRAELTADEVRHLTTGDDVIVELK